MAAAAFARAVAANAAQVAPLRQKHVALVIARGVEPRLGATHEVRLEPV